jgi:hypothetical protein
LSGGVAFVPVGANFFLEGTVGDAGIFVYSSCCAVFISPYRCFGISSATSHGKDYNQVHILPRFISATSSGGKGREQYLIYLICNNAMFSRSGSVFHSVTLQLRKIFCSVK